MTQQIRELFLPCPEKEARAIAAHTAMRGSGRVGRSAAGRKLRESALTMAVVAAVRHGHTRYEELLAAKRRPRIRAPDQVAAKWRKSSPT